jgi:deoxycytidylate deaminase
MNAIEDAERREIDIEGAWMYLTKEPCEQCVGQLDAYRLSVMWPDDPTS